MVVQEVMIPILIRAMRDAHRALIRANRALEEEQRNIQFGKLGSSLIIIGAMSAAVTIVTLLQPPEMIFAYTTYMHVIRSIVLCFTAVTGLAGITFGTFLLSMNNPGRYRHLAMVMLWASCVAAAFSIGILLMASFSLP